DLYVPDLPIWLNDNPHRGGRVAGALEYLPDSGIGIRIPDAIDRRFKQRAIGPRLGRAALHGGGVNHCSRSLRGARDGRRLHLLDRRGLGRRRRSIEQFPDLLARLRRGCRSLGRSKRLRDRRRGWLGQGLLGLFEGFGTIPW